MIVSKEFTTEREKKMRYQVGKETGVLVLDLGYRLSEGTVHRSGF